MFARVRSVWLDGAVCGTTAAIAAALLSRLSKIAQRLSLRLRRVLRLLIDTSVWLDLAKRRDAQKWIVPLSVLKHQGKLELAVPLVVVEEFERNRPRAEAAVTSSVLGRFQQLRKDLHEFGGDARMEWLEEMAHQVPMVSSGTLRLMESWRAVLFGAQGTLNHKLVTGTP